MNKYKAKKFIDALEQKVNGRDDFKCPYCGSDEFESFDKYAAIPIEDNLNSVHLGATIPSGILVCKKCGHIDFFALGSLGLLEEGDVSNGD